MNNPQRNEEKKQEQNILSQFMFIIKATERWVQFDGLR